MPDLIRLGSLLFAAFLAYAPGSHAQSIQTIDVESRVIKQFSIGTSETQFGPLEFVGGLEMTSAMRDFGAISGIELANDQSKFLAVADTGFWLEGEIVRNGDNAPIGLANVTMSEISGGNGAPIAPKWRADAEGIVATDQDIVVSFERAHRIAHFERRSTGSPTFDREYSPPVPLYELRSNQGFEGIAQAPEATPLSGALVGISERSLDKNKNIMGFVQDQSGETFEFSVMRTGEFDITDLAFLPNGNLIVLERRFNVSDGIGMRLRHISASGIKKGATVDGETILLADFLYQIDNMEGLSITADDDGTPRLTIVSDDNHSLLQRNLLLEFRLTGALAD